MSSPSRGGCGFIGSSAEAGGPGSHSFDDAFDLLDVRPFMASQPPSIEQRGSLEYLSRSCHCHRAFPGIDRQRGEDCQEIGTLRGKSVQ